jgi:hypothetical protein
MTTRPPASSHSPAAIVLQHRGALRDHGLAGIHFGHFAAELTEALLDLGHHRGVARKLAAEEIGDGVACAIIFRWTEASAGDNQLGALGGFVESVAQGREIVADNGLARDFDA